MPFTWTELEFMVTPQEGITLRINFMSEKEENDSFRRIISDVYLMMLKIKSVAGNQAANEVGYDKAPLLCLASISAGLANITNGAKEAKGIVAVDGCPMNYAKKTLEKAGFNLDEHLVVTKNLAISKNCDLNSPPDLEKIKDSVVEKINRVYEK